MVLSFLVYYISRKIELFININGSLISGLLYKPEN